MKEKDLGSSSQKSGSSLWALKVPASVVGSGRKKTGGGWRTWGSSYLGLQGLDLVIHMTHGPAGRSPCAPISSDRPIGRPPDRGHNGLLLLQESLGGNVSAGNTFFIRELATGCSFTDLLATGCSCTDPLVTWCSCSYPHVQLASYMVLLCRSS